MFLCVDSCLFTDSKALSGIYTAYSSHFTTLLLAYSFLIAIHFTEKDYKYKAIICIVIGLGGRAVLAQGTEPEG